MPTRQDYLNQGYTEQQINQAIIGKKLGQTVDASGQYGAPVSSGAPISSANPVNAPVTPTSTAAQAPVNNPPAQQTVQNQPISSQSTQVEKTTTTTTPQGETVVKKETPWISPEETKRLADNAAHNTQVEILTWLNQAYKDSPDMFQDQGTFRASQGYDTSSPEKKKVLDAFFQAKNAQQNNPDALFQSLISGVPIYNQELKNTPQFKQAQTRLDNLRQYSSYNSNQFATAISSGQLLPGTQTYNDLQRDPKLKVSIEKANTLNQVNGNKLDTNKAVSTVMNDIVDNSPLGQAMKDGYISAEEANQFTTTPEIQAKSDALLKLQNDVTTKQNSYDNIRTEVENELKGTGATTSQREALIGSRQRDMLGGLNLAIGLYNNSLGQLSDMKKQQADLFDRNLWLYQDREKQAQQIASEARQFGRQKELAQFQQNLQLQGNQAEFDQKIKQQAQLANDPYTAISTVMDEYKKLGIPFTQSIQTKVADAQKFIAGGGTIAGYVDKMIGDIQAKPEYKAIQEKALESTANKPFTVASGSSVYDPVTKTFVSASWNAIPMQKSQSNAVSAPIGSQGGDCGEFANKLTWQSWTPGGNSLSARIQAFNDQTPKVGGEVLFSGGGYDKTYGHIAVVTGVNSDGTINVKESNYKGDKTVTERNNVPLTYVKWFYNNTPLAGGSNIEPADILVYNSLTPSDKKKMQNDIGFRNFETQKKTVMDDRNSSIDQILEYSRGGTKLNQTAETQLEKYQQAMNQIDGLTKDIKWVTTWPIMGILSSNNPYDTKAQALKAKLTSLIPNLARGVYGEVGVLTDNDIANYSKTVPNLRSTEDVNKAILAMTLDTISNGYKAKIATLAKANFDVSGFKSIYEDIRNQSDALKNSLGSTWTQKSTNTVSWNAWTYTW